MMTMKDAARVLGMTFGEKLAHMLPKKGAKITHSKPVIPRRPGSWPATILIAEPVLINVEDDMKGRYIDDPPPIVEWLSFSDLALVCPSGG